MPLDRSGQIAFVVIMAILFLLIIPVIQSRTGKSLTELFFGSGKLFRRKNKDGTPKEDTSSKPRREPRINNGTKGEWTNFVSMLLRFANKNGMALVVPGTLRSGGKKANLLALLVTPSSKIIGIQCLGFGGTITPPEEGDGPWNQHANSQDIPFDNPVVTGEAQRQLAQAAVDRAGIHGTIDVVTVFTNSRTTFAENMPCKVYTTKSFFEYLNSNTDLRSGPMDTRAISLKLAELAGIQKKHK